jgi:hypothetical protein
MINNTWDTKIELHSIINQLGQLGWIIKNQNYTDYADLEYKNKKLEVNFTHIPRNLNYDYIITDSVKKNFLTLAPAVFGNYYHNFDYTDHKPTKKFSCFIHRGCPVRQSWFYFLIKHKHLDNAHITYWCNDRNNGISPEIYFETLFESGNQLFKKEHNFAKKNLQIPYKNFDLQIEQAVIDSEKTLVIETFFEPQDINNYSEKTFRALQLPRPFLLFSTPNNVKMLREWGFEVYDDHINHSYDEEQDWIKRQSLILDQLAKPIEYTESVLKDFEQRAQHNRNLLKSYKQQWPGFFTEFLEQIKTL